MDLNENMTTIDFIASLKKMQISIQLANGQLKINAPKGKLTPALLNELKERKEAIIDFLISSQKHLKSKYESIEPVEKKDYYVLSPAQKRLFILQQMESETTSYNMPMVIPLTKGFNRQQLETALKALIDRHESLRTSFTVIEDEPVQRVHDEVDFKITDIDSDSSGNIIKSLMRPFDLSQAPLLRVVLIRVEPSKSMLFVDTHHIINDGVSHTILARELTELSTGNELLPLRLQYKDYAEWFNSEAQQAQIKQQALYWQERFAGDIPVLNLPTDYLRPVVQSFEGSSLRFVLAEIGTRGIKSLASTGEATLYMSILSIFTILLSRLSGQEDIIVGTPTAGRRHADLEHIIGMFVNTLALRNFPCGWKSFYDFLREVKESTLEAFENQEYPFERLVEKVSVNRDPGRNPVFDVMFALQNMAEETVGGEEDHSYVDKNNVAKFDLTLVAVETGDGFTFTLEYCTRLFKEETIDRFSGYFKNIIKSIAENPSQRISDVEMLTETEKRQLLVEFNDTGEPYPIDKTIPQLFTEQMERTPDHIAVFCHGQTRTNTDNNMIITYRELNEQSNRLAGLLMEKGVECGTIVGIMVKRSSDMIIYILGILKAGGAYLPIDPDAPYERIDYMLKDSGAKILLRKEEYEKKIIVNCQLLIVNCELLMSSSQEPFHHSSFIIHHSSHLAYIIYTSGSTGKPKGVPITHSNLCQLLHWGYRHLGLGTKDRFLQNLSYYFDWSVWEIFIGLTTGASMYMVPKDLLLNPEACVAFMTRNHITVLHVTPTQYQYYLKAPEKPWTLKYLFIGAEKLTRELVEKSFESVDKDCRVFNMYGPTECTIISAVLEIERTDAAKFENLSSVPIGRAVGNIDLLILDRYLNLSPVNVWGELYIAGDCAARGYLNNPELTAGRFINNRFYRSDKTNIFYKTGDLARRLVDGNVEFLGRIDQQVKIRGFRIELGEIESELLKYGLVKEAVVIDRQGESGEKYLCGYIVEKEKFDLSRLKEYLSKSLPDYMIPSYFMRIGAIPLNPNGKLDRKALPAIDVQIQTGRAFVAPANEIEERLAALWVEILDIEKDKLSMDENFFELGGHSLKATILSAKIHKTFDVKIPLVEIFRLPTIRESAQYIQEMRALAKDNYAAVAPVEKKEYYVLSSMQRRLYILQQMVPLSTVYNMPQVQLLSAVPDKEKLAETFKRLIRRHESLRTSFIAVNEKPVQKIHDEVEFEIEYYDLAANNAKGREEGRGDATLSLWSADIITNFVRPFDLSRVPLLRVGLVKTEEEKYLLMIDMHHIISDGVSQGVLLQEFLAIYDGVSLPSLLLHYKDFAEWQNNPAHQETLKRQERYWSDRLSGELPVLNLPYDYPRPEVQGFEGRQLDFFIGPGETSALKALAAREDATLYMVLLAAFYLLSARLSGQEDIIVGAPVAGRSHADIQQIIGMFVNTLALRNYPAAEKTIGSFLQEVKTNALGAFENQDYPFEDLVEKVTVVRDIGRNPVFDVVFVLQNLAEQGAGAESAAAAPSYRYEGKTAKFDMTLFAVETGENLTFLLEYCTRLFKEDTIGRFINYFKNIVVSIAANSHQRIADVEMLTEEEKLQLMVEFNDTGEPFPKDKTIHQLFEEQVERTPDHITIIGAALTFRPVGPVGPVSLSYRELHDRSRRFAGLLQEKGVKSDSIVALMMERSLEMIIGIFGILKAGGAYLPIDPDYPRDRIDYMLNDSNARILINKSEIRNPKFETNPNYQKINDQNKNQYFGAAFVLNFEHLNFDIVSNFDIRASNLIPSNLAYIIYTSGSTGMPKGVMIEQRSVVNRLNWMQKAYPIGDGDVILQKTTFTFDVSVWELFWWSSRGACVYLLGTGEEKDPAAIVHAVTNYRVTTMHFVPSMLNVFLDFLENEGGAEAVSSRLRSLRKVFASGEALGPVQVERFYRLFGKGGANGAKLINLYGPTEATVDVSYFDCVPDEKYERIPIGKPIDNINLYVLDKSLHLQPVGVVGELYIAGVGLARGYLNRPELTAEKFIRSFAGVKGGLFQKPPLVAYKTGDLARWLRDGNIEYLGRIDHQVKIRGFRIELGEIENRLLAEPAVKDAVVMARIDPSGDKQLAAYVVPDETVAFTVHRLLEIERNKLRGEGDRLYYELPNGMPVFYLNRNETDFMYREIFEECSYLKHGVTLKDSSCIFDIGANIGIFSLFANYVCPDAAIYSFEPVPALYDLLALNTSLYGLNFKIFKNGIASKEEEVVFTYYPHASILSGRFADDAEEKETVKAFIHRELEAAGRDRREMPTEAQIDELLAERISGIRFHCAMKTVSQVMRENGVERIDLLKIDVEKAELDVLEGIEAADWPKIRQLVIEVHDSGGRLAKIMDLLKRHGYEVVVEQDSMLEETGLYNLYAISPISPVSPQQEQGPRWEPAAGHFAQVEPGRYSPGRLIDDLKESLKLRLPGYMVPSHFVLLDKMPLTASGKVDRKALPAPEVNRGEGYEAPANEIEEKLAALWSEILNIGKENISVTARFFDLGGHSLKATVMLSRIDREFMVRIPLVQVFSTPTIRGLADYLKGLAQEAAVVEDHQLARLRKGSGAEPGYLFLVHDGSGEVEGYVEFCRRLEPDIDCWGIRAEKLTGYGPLNISIETIARNYIEKMKSLQSHGPYRIAGWSLGGTIAFEMAYQLETMGETVSFLGLIDSPAPAPTSLKKETFTAGSELAWLKDYIPGEQINERLKGITDINKTWWEVIAYLEENHYPVEAVRQLIPAYLAQIIPNYERLGLRELVYYLNLGRSLDRARDIYIPGGKINTELHHFTAVDSKEILKESWAEYCHSAIRVYELSGNHYSILKMPAVDQTAQLISRELSEH